VTPRREDVVVILLVMFMSEMSWQDAQIGLFCLSGSSGLSGLTKQTKQTK
jgi:hypothetical protein